MYRIVAIPFMHYTTEWLEAVTTGGYHVVGTFYRDDKVYVTLYASRADIADALIENFDRAKRERND